MNVEFLDELHVSKRGEGWVLDQQFRALVTDGSNAFKVEVPAGFETDFASVPRLPLAYLVAGNTSHKAAVIHDYLYKTQAPRADADAVFRAAMRAEGVSAWRRGLMWAAVRAFGWAPYNGHKAAIEAIANE